MEHIFKDGTNHCKAVCKKCFWMQHLPKENLVFVNSDLEYTEHLWKEFKRKRNQFRKQKSLRMNQIGMDFFLADTSDEL